MSDQLLCPFCAREYDSDTWVDPEQELLYCVVGHCEDNPKTAAVMILEGNKKAIPIEKIDAKIKHFEMAIKEYAKPSGELERVYNLIIEELEDLKNG